MPKVGATIAPFGPLLHVESTSGLTPTQRQLVSLEGHRAIGLPEPIPDPVPQPFAWPIVVLAADWIEPSRLRVIVSADARPDIGDRLLIDNQPAVLTDIVHAAGPLMLLAVPDTGSVSNETATVALALREPLACERVRWREFTWGKHDLIDKRQLLMRAPRGEFLPEPVVTCLAARAPAVLRCALERQNDDPITPLPDQLLPDLARPASAANPRRLRADVALAGIGFRIGGSPSEPGIEPLTDDAVLAMSAGQVRRPATLNKRTERTERDGTHCERIFGPTRNHECVCGKYVGVKFAGTTCDRCGVDVVPATMRWRRSGHIQLPVPLIPFWAQSVIARLCGLSHDALLRVVFFQDVMEEDADAATGWGQASMTDRWRAGADQFGARVIGRVLESQTGERLQRRIDALPADDTARATLEAWRDGRIALPHLLRQTIPVSPAGFRPAPSGNTRPGDHDHLLMQLINRANRLFKLEQLNAPFIILQNELRMLQMALWSLEANHLCRRPVSGAGRRTLESCIDLAVRTLDPPPDDWRMVGTIRTSVRVDPDLPTGHVRLPSPIFLRPYDHDSAPHLLVWSATAVGTLQLADPCDGWSAAVSVDDAREFGLADGSELSLFQPRDELAQAALATFDPCANGTIPATHKPADAATLLDSLVGAAITNLPLPFTPADSLLRLGLLPD